MVTEHDVIKALTFQKDIEWGIGLNVEKLFYLLMFHRLTGRFLREVEQRRHLSQPDRGFIVKLKQYHLKERQDHEQKVEFLKQLNGRLKDGQEAIPVKGIPSVFWASDPYSVRRSVDLDLVCPDERSLKETLLQQGFMQTNTVAAHEYASLHQDGLIVEIHKWFPINRSPRIEKIGEYAQIHHTASGRNIGYNDIREYSCLHETGMLIPDCHISVLLIAANLYKDFLSARYPLQYYNLAEILELIRLPVFDKTKFAKLAERYNAYDILEFIHILCVKLGDYSRFLMEVGFEHASLTNHALLEYNMGIYIESDSVEHMFIKNYRNRKMKDYNKNFGRANVVKLYQETVIDHIFAVFSQFGAANSIHVTLKIDFTEESLHYKLTVPKLIPFSHLKLFCGCDLNDHTLSAEIDDYVRSTVTGTGSLSVISSSDTNTEINIIFGTSVTDFGELNSLIVLKYWQVDKEFARYIIPLQILES